MEIIVRHFAKLERLERQWVIDRLHDDHFHKLPANLPPYLLRSNVTSQPTTGERKHDSSELKLSVERGAPCAK